MSLPALRAFLVCILVAGTAAGTLPSEPRLTSGDSPAATAGSPADGLTIEGDPGGVDARRTYRRLGALYDRDLPALTARFNRDGGVEIRETHPDPLFGLLADSTVRIDRPVRGAASEGRASVSYRPGTSPGFVERVLVHELAHALEPASLREDMASAAGDYAGTTDARLAREAVAEGTAVYVADAYAERYLDATSQSAWLALAWPTMTDATRLLWAPYRYGVDHVRARVSSPAQLGTVYADPPLTTERVLHPGEDDGRRPLAVDSAGPVADLDRAATDTKGELYLQVLLSGELDPDRAARAAAGWDNDRLVTYSGKDPSFAWVLRWDSPGDATQFEAAMTDYLDATATRRADLWMDGEAAFRLERSGETCSLLAGDPEFVRTAQVSEDGSGVVVS